MKSLVRRSGVPRRAVAGRHLHLLPATAASRSIASHQASIARHLTSAVFTGPNATHIDPSTFPRTKGFNPLVDGKPHFTKILIANRYVASAQFFWPVLRSRS